MNSGVRESASTGAQIVTVSFGEKYASSAAFDTVYRDGMALVEETAAYLDGTGRQDAKSLKEFERLPGRLRSLVDRSFVLHDQISRLDQVISGEAGPSAGAEVVASARDADGPNSPDAQQQRLQAAFRGFGQ